MTKQDIIDKLKELGIKTDNCYPKNSFVQEGTVYVGLFKRELEDDFYFYVPYTKSLYHLPKQDTLDNFKEEKFQDKPKFLVPLDKARVVWKEEQEFEELVDELFTKVTIRQYACIHLGLPESGLPWLDDLITKSKIK